MRSLDREWELALVLSYKAVFDHGGRFLASGNIGRAIMVGAGARIPARSEGQAIPLSATERWRVIELVGRHHATGTWV